MLRCLVYFLVIRKDSMCLEQMFLYSWSCIWDKCWRQIFLQSGNWEKLATVAWLCPADVNLGTSSKLASYLAPLAPEQNSFPRGCKLCVWKLSFSFKCTLGTNFTFWHECKLLIHRRGQCQIETLCCSIVAPYIVNISCSSHLSAFSLFGSYLCTSLAMKFPHYPPVLNNSKNPLRFVIVNKVITPVWELLASLFGIY